MSNYNQPFLPGIYVYKYEQVVVYCIFFKIDWDGNAIGSSFSSGEWSRFWAFSVFKRLI